MDAMKNNDTIKKAEEFFERYAAALLARDAKAIAGMYAVPALILFPGTSIPVVDARQTEEFFASSWRQYEGVDTMDKKVTIVGEARPAASGPTSPGPTAASRGNGSVTSSSTPPGAIRSLS